MKNKVELVVLPTRDGSVICGTTQLEYRGIDTQIDSLQNQHLYATISQDVESIKEGDWYYDVVLNKVFQLKEICPHDICDYMSNQYNKFRTDSNNARKIITTDDTNINIEIGTVSGTTYIEHLPQLQQSFLKEFCDNPDGEFEVEYETVTHNKGANGFSPMFTTNELKLNQDNTVNITLVKEKMYSLSDLERLGDYAYMNAKSTWDWKKFIKENL